MQDESVEQNTREGSDGGGRVNETGYEFCAVCRRMVPPRVQVEGVRHGDFTLGNFHEFVPEREEEPRMEVAP
jgi:hypothetical protein